MWRGGFGEGGCWRLQSSEDSAQKPPSRQRNFFKRGSALQLERATSPRPTEPHQLHHCRFSSSHHLLLPTHTHDYRPLKWHASVPCATGMNLNYYLLSSRMETGWLTDLSAEAFFISVNWSVSNPKARNIVHARQQKPIASPSAGRVWEL